MGCSLRAVPVAAAALLVLSACDGQSVTSPETFVSVHQSKAETLAAISNGKEAGPLYVANDAQASDPADVTAYGTDGSGPNLTITKGIHLSQRAIAFDSQSNVYVAMSARRGGGGNVVEYANGTSRIVRNVKVPEAKALAFDSSDNLYVLGLKSVEVFQPGSVNPSKTITNGIKNPTSMVLDKAGNIYVANNENANSVTVYSVDGTLTQTITDGVDYPLTLATDKQGRLYVGNSNESVTVYKPGQNAVWKTFGLSNNGQIACIALDPKQNVYLASGDGNSVEVFSAAPKFQSIRTIKTDVVGPNSLAFDAAGDLFVSDSAANDVTKYLPGSDTIDATISSGIHSPQVVAVDK